MRSLVACSRFSLLPTWVAISEERMSSISRTTFSRSFRWTRSISYLETLDRSRASFSS